MGEQVATKLLQPEKIADDLCSMVGGALRNKNVVGAIRDGVQGVVVTHDREIASFLAPKIEVALVSEIDRLVTVEKIGDFWADHLEPKLKSAEARDEIATLVIGALERRAPTLAAKTRPIVLAAIREYVEGKGGKVGSFLAPLSETIADFIISKKTIEGGLRNWLRAPDTIPAVRDELLQFVRMARGYVRSDASRVGTGAFVEEIRSAFKAYVRNYIEKNLADVAGRVLNSESLWDGVVNMIPKFQSELECLIRREGMPVLMENLDIQGRVKTAVDQMDVAEFHGMINEVAAQHLGAIQVLGYLLGAVAGGLTLLV